MLTGCKLSVQVGSGGNAISSSGTRDCLETSTCIFDVVDTDFGESFTAVPKAGYKFVKWRAGSEFLCGDSANPVCVTSNVTFEGNATAEAIIASEQEYKIRPEFEPTSAPKYAVRDKDGDLVGEALSVSAASSVSVRLMHIAGDGKKHGYRLQFQRNEVVDKDYIGVYWDNPSCTGANVYLREDTIGRIKSTRLAPLFSNEYSVYLATENGERKFNIVKVPPVEDVVSLQPYQRAAESCYLLPDPDYTYLQQSRRTTY